MATLPKASTPLVRGPQGALLMEPEWYRLFQLIVGDTNGLLDATGTANTMPGNITGSAAADTRLTATQIKAFLAIANTDVSGLGDFATADSFDHVDAICGVIDYPEAKDYIVGLNMPFAFTVNTMTTRLTAGTCTVAAKKNTTAITGISSHSATTSEVTSTATAGNSFAAGDDVRLTVSSVSSTCEGLAFTIKITRTVTP